MAIIFRKLSVCVTRNKQDLLGVIWTILSLNELEKNAPCYKKITLQLYQTILASLTNIYFTLECRRFEPQNVCRNRLAAHFQN